MRSEITKTGSKIILVFLLLALISCAAEKRYKILTVFFDGVPKPGEKKEQEKSETKPQDQAGQQEGQPQKDVIRLISRHPGFAEKACDNCHDQSASNFLRTQTEDLCFTCHDQSDFQGTFVHGPVAVRECLTCHLPHESQYRNLLKEKDEELCLYCHLGEDIAQNPAHSTGNQCTECHYAHAAANRFLLKDGVSAQEGE